MKKNRKIFPVLQLDFVYEQIYKELYAAILPKGCLDLLTYIISELSANVKEHSFAKKVNIEVAIRKKSFYFRISDDGIGIKRSFIKNGIFTKDDRAAIELAVGGISTKKQNERAFGLFSTQRLATHTGGKMNIISGKVKATFKENETKFEAVKKEMKGVTVEVDIPLKPVNVYEVLY